MLLAAADVTHPAIRDLVRKPGTECGVPGVLRLAGHGRSTADLLFWPNHYRESHLPCAAGTSRGAAHLVVVDGNKQAEALSDWWIRFMDLLSTSRDTQRPQMIPASTHCPSKICPPTTRSREQRAIGLWRLATRTVPITITPVASALLRTESREFYRQLALTLRPPKRFRSKT